MRTLFGNILRGQLGRLRYFFWSIGLGVASAALAIWVASSLGVLENLQTNSDAAITPEQIQDRFGNFGLFGIFLAGSLLGFASANLTAKRLRDTGLPGWKIFAALAIFGIALAAIFSSDVTGVVRAVVLIALIFIPTGIFARHRAPKVGDQGFDN